VGTWKATAGKDSVYLVITEDSQFTWKATPAGRDPVAISGMIETARDAIALVSESAGTMAGKKEGGARPGEVGEILRLHGSLPSEDLRLLVRWGLFNWLFGNCDVQAKNISIIFDPNHGIRLAPFYGLVGTRVYKSLDRHLAMSIGEQFDRGGCR
jgi:hypothetical protein